MAKVQTDRREFVKYSTLGILGAVLGGGILFSPYPLKAEHRLRPPGALPEKDFLALCIKCGQCLQVCPYHSIELSDMTTGHGVGTPHIDANIRACYACEAVPCVLACPSGALDHKTEKATDIKMGIAVLQNPKTCLAVTNQPVPASYLDEMKLYTAKQTNINPLEIKLLERMQGYEGKACTLCADICPMPNPLSAIEMVTTGVGITKPMIYDGCSGCGACQEICPTSVPSIVIKQNVTYEEYYKNKS